jgi:hypothetical protein
VVDRARDAPGLVARIAFLDDGVVTVHTSALALDLAACRPAAGGRQNEGTAVARQHGTLVGRARIGSLLRTRIAWLAERGIALDVAAVHDLATVRSVACAPNAEASVLANERSGTVRRARIILRWPDGAAIALGCQGVVALARRTVTLASARALAENLCPGARKRAAAWRPSGWSLLTYERAIGARTEDLIGDGALLAGGRRRPATRHG